MDTAKLKVAEVPADGMPRAQWVDASTNPKNHGEFEGHLKGESDKIRRYFWTGRRWLFKDRKQRWVQSVFGEKGDKWRGLAEDLSVKAPATGATEPATPTDDPSAVRPSPAVEAPSRLKSIARAAEDRKTAYVPPGIGVDDAADVAGVRENYEHSRPD